MSKEKLSTAITSRFLTMESSDVLYKASILYSSFYKDVVKECDLDYRDLYMAYREIKIMMGSGSPFFDLSFKSLIKELYRHLGKHYYESDLYKVGCLDDENYDLEGSYKTFVKTTNPNIESFDFHIVLTPFLNKSTYIKDGNLMIMSEADFIKLKIKIKDDFKFNLGEGCLYKFTYKNYIRDAIIKHLDKTI